MSPEEANEVVEVAKKTQNGLDRVHPVSLIDMWSPPNLMPTPTEKRMRVLAVQYAADLPLDYAAIDVIINVYEKLKTNGIESYTIDDDWARLLRRQLGKHDDMFFGREVDANKLIRYHSLLWKTGQGWTYRRTPQEMSMDRAYNPNIATGEMSQAITSFKILTFIN